MAVERKQKTGHGGREKRETCSDEGYVDSRERISSEDEVTSHELRLSLKSIVVTAEPAKTEELRVGNGELGVDSLTGEEIKV